MVRVFFFSSRRRHTRCGRDWSSDVCSSDLKPVELIIMAGTGGGADQIARLLQGLIEQKELSPRPFVPINKPGGSGAEALDRKSTRLNSSHVRISYAVFCLKKKKERVENLMF